MSAGGSPSDEPARPTGATPAAETPIGGQAVIEGVMIRGLRSWAVAMRTPAGDVEVVDSPLDPWALRHRALRLPVIRGIVALADSMRIGFRALAISAAAQVEGRSRGRDGEPAGPEPGRGDRAGDARADDARAWGPASFLILGLAIGLFFVAPAAIALLVGLGALWSFLLVETVLRLAIFTGYVASINRSAGLRRTLEYHGAEHKAIACHEAGDALVPERAARFSRLHPRCGTSFLLTVMVLAAVVFAPVGLPAWYWVLISRVALLPVAVGISYEAIRWLGRHRGGAIGRILSRPGLMLQRLTTREPDRDQLAVAIAALEPVLAREGSAPRAADGGVDVVA